jgi:hypothetical protein
MEYEWVEPKNLPEKIKEKLKNRHITSAKKKDGKYIVETTTPEIFIDFRKIFIFNENGEEEYNIYDTKLVADIDGEEYKMIGISVETLLKRLVKALVPY